MVIVASVPVVRTRLNAFMLKADVVVGAWCQVFQKCWDLATDGRLMTTTEQISIPFWVTKTEGANKNLYKRSRNKTSIYDIQ
jgi:hypothetical protein